MVVKKIFCYVLFFKMYFTSVAMSSSELKVLVTIKPFHSIVSGVMQGVAEPILLLNGKNSPHSHSLMPSNAKYLQEANVIFWGGENLETFLKKPIKSLGTKAKIVSLQESKGIIKWNLRKNIQFEKSSHQDENRQESLGNSSKKFGVDPHIWLDPFNAKIIVKTIVHVLSNMDQKNKKIFHLNGESYVSRIDELNNQLEIKMKEISTMPYIVFHDAYQYFEKRYNLNIVGTLTLNIAYGTSVRRLIGIQQLIKKRKIRCIFSEPQFSQKLVKTVVNGTEIRIEKLDPIGINLDGGPELYFNLINNMADSFKRCLSG